MTAPVGTKIGIVFVLGLLILVAVGVTAHVSVERLLEANRWVHHAHKVERELEHVLWAHLDAETGQRGFILTGQPRYLEPYEAAARQIRQDMATVSHLIAGDAEQLEDFQQLQKLSDAKLAEMRQTIQRREQSGLEAALPAVRSDRGKKLMDDLRSVVARMAARQHVALDQRNAAADASANRTIAIVSLWMPLALVVLGIAAVAIARTVRFGGPVPPPETRRKRWAGIAVRYGAAVMIVAVATVLRWRLLEAFGPMPLFIVFYPAVLLVATLAGGGPGIAATVLSAMAAVYWFMLPYQELHLGASSDMVALGIFTASSLILCVLAERLRRARWVEAFNIAQAESRERLEAIVSSAMDAIIAVDAAQRIELFNAAAEKSFRCPAGEAIGRPLERFIPQRFRADHARHVQDFGEHGTTSRAMGRLGTLVALRADGEEFPMEASISQTQVGGRKLFTVILRDITKRQQREESLRETAEELRRSNRELEQFAYVASHDLQEPLRQVRSFVQLLSEHYLGKLDAKAEQYMHYICEGATRMSDLIQDLLAYSRVGARDAPRQQVSCGDVLESALANLRTSIAETQARITHDDLPALTADATELAQLFQNLVGNAIKFRREGVPPEIHVGAHSDGSHWILSVRDNGIGIEREFYDRVFLIFQRLHGRGKYPGTGIGLAICKKIVEQQGGNIWIESAVGQGTTFFSLPKDGV